MADNDVEIRVSTVYDGKKGGDAARKDIDDVGDSARELDRRMSRTLDNIGADLGRVERKLVDPFEDAADKIPREFDDVERKVEDKLDDIDASGAADGITNAFESIDLGGVGQNITGQLSGIMAVGGPIAAIGGLAATAFADDFTDGINRGFRGNRALLEQRIKTGLPVATLRQTGAAAGEAYADGFGEGLGELKNTANLLQVELSKVDDGLDLSRVTREATVLNDIFGVELPNSVRTTRRLVAQDLVNDSSAALNLMADAAQRLPTEFEDVIDVANEFSPVFARMGLSGEQAFDFIIRTAQRGFFPTMDRAAEMVQEFNIRLNEFDTLREPIQALGLDFADLQDQLARGDGAQALETIVAQILRVGSETDRNAIAVDFFGASIEDVADKTGVLEQLMKTLNGELEVNAGALEAATLQAEKLNNTPMNKLKREISGLGEDLGRSVDSIVGDIERFGEGIGLMGDAATDGERELSGFEKGLRNFVEAADQTTTSAGEAERGLIDLGGPLDKVGLGFLADTTAVEGLTAALDTSEAEMRNQIGEMGALGGTAEDLEAGYNDLGDQIDLTREAQMSLTESFDAFFRISADDRIASIHEAGDRLIETMKELDESTFNASGSINLASESGRDLHDQMSNLRSQLIGATEEFQDGTITAGEYETAQRLVEDQLDRVEAQGQFTKAEMQQLRDEYGLLPPDVQTDVIANDKASNILDDVNRAIGAIPRSVTVSVTQRMTGFFGGSTRRGQSGGVRSGPTVVGEEGIELVNLQNGSMIRSNPDTARDLRLGNRGGGAAPVINVTVLGSVISNRELIATVRDAARNGAFTGVGGITAR